LNSEFKSKTEEREWRRSKVLELKSQGLDQREIAHILRVSPATITFDLQCLRDEARQNVHEYTTRLYPLQFKISLIAFQNILKEYWNIVQNTKDNKEKMQALEYYRQANMDMIAMIQRGGISMEQSMAGQKEKEKRLQQQYQQLEEIGVK
jgi:orotate phosphoribosyltransferase-like protein